MNKTAEWISIKDAVAVSGYHKNTIRDLAKENKIKSRKIVTVWQVSRTSLLAYLSKMQARGAKTGKKSSIDK